MFRIRARHIMLALVVVVGFAPAPARSQTCNLETPCGATISCKGGCAAPVSVFHATASPCGAPVPVGGFDLTQTQYAGTCLLGSACPVDVPPLRFWQYDAYAKANSGCLDAVAGSYMANGALDFSIGPTPGYWFLYQGNWLNPAADGCATLPNGELRTVAEISFPHRPAEGTVGHSSWYLIAAVDNQNDYDFDRITGGSGCAPGVIAAAPVAGVTPTGLLGPCTGGTVVTTYANNAVDTGYFDVPVSLVDPGPAYYTEAGLSPPSKRLIAGYQILYAGGTTLDASAEPTSSDFVTGGWRVARDTTNPALAHGVIAWGTPTATVAIPKGVCVGLDCGWYWLATRLVYQDSALNPGGVFDPAGPGPLVVSDVSGHCGPVAGTDFVSVTWAGVSAERGADGVRIAWSTASEDDTLGFRVVRMVGTPGMERVEALPDAVEARGAYSPYELVDRAALDLATTYRYYVQEITTAGLDGDRSPVVVAPASAPADPADPGEGGGRSRRGRRSR